MTLFSTKPNFLSFPTQIVPGIDPSWLPRPEHDGRQPRDHHGHLLEPRPRHPEHLPSLPLRAEEGLLHIPAGRYGETNKQMTDMTNL